MYESLIIAKITLNTKAFINKQDLVNKFIDTIKNESSSVQNILANYIIDKISVTPIPINNIEDKLFENFLLIGISLLNLGE